METPLEEALGVMVETFYKYSAKEGDKYKLNKKEMKELLLEEMPNFVKVKKGKINERGFEFLMEKLDNNEDEELDFQEYAVFLALTASLCYAFFQECADENNRKQ
ncbi:protein S100-A2-like isoform X1 [Crotalus tigris]|uniref:protein S100-A2-like isoform X1 n=1 Tax=Crotalus tigris TaxID=88082 RepID=UPI00192F4B1B|nr:protein S100-A2-like isoform X1 [Crotalus tigris]XP_039219133.1 protein S100-A2-like isoform X1 [Crotalus tigris]